MFVLVKTFEFELSGVITVLGPPEHKTVAFGKMTVCQSVCMFESKRLHNIKSGTISSVHNTSNPQYLQTFIKFFEYFISKGSCPETSLKKLDFANFSKKALTM